MNITNISTGIDPARVQQNQPAFFVSWCEDGKRQYYFSAIRSEIERIKQRLERVNTPSREQHEQTMAARTVKYGRFSEKLVRWIEEYENGDDEVWNGIK